MKQCKKLTISVKRSILASIIFIISILYLLDSNFPFLGKSLLRTDRSFETTLFVLFLFTPGVYLISYYKENKNYYYYGSIWWIVGLVLYRFNTYYWDVDKAFEAIGSGLLFVILGYFFFLYGKKNK